MDVGTFRAVVIIRYAISDVVTMFVPRDNMKAACADLAIDGSKAVPSGCSLENFHTEIYPATEMRMSSRNKEDDQKLLTRRA